MKLSVEQHAAVHCTENVYVTACPGSGKTRALTARIAKGVEELKYRSNKVLAVTFTNRAADEIKTRLEENYTIESGRVWAGTIHSFALEWIIKPYASYAETLNYGYSIADEFETRKILSKLKVARGLRVFDDVNTTFNRQGMVENSDARAKEVEQEYRQILSSRKKIDFDQSLYFAFQLMERLPEIAQTLGNIFTHICVDEIQDTQDLQYAILSKIFNESCKKPSLFIVGDENQAIYGGIGGKSLSLAELNSEFIDSNINHFTFSDNYRSTQRLVDYFSVFRGVQGGISKAAHKNDQGTISFFNQSVHKDYLAEAISKLIQTELNNGVNENDICVIAPQWEPIRSMTKKLITLLPQVKFDAPALSPFHGQHDNFWLIVSKLLLTEPSGMLLSTRVRWANELLNNLIESHHHIRDLTAKKLLKVINSFHSNTVVGTEYLKECFEFILDELDIDLVHDLLLKEQFDLFFEKATSNIENNNDQYEDTVIALKSFFKESTGIVVDSCHGVKGEEYNTVIAFGLLKGFVPHWKDIINQPAQLGRSAESKMLYVIASRAKENLFLFAENGRMTARHNFYTTSEMLSAYNFRYD
ncbi:MULTISPECIES: ATP-dependent helicase [unclassified Francisella]|uniref:ATP-dependent helicase n=1 Tax=unclassified Francisella TaxID=2610885 RepID=UPI002E374079|nr:MULTISPECIES: ATP-dependent helicase [unclassified Francisella]MED7819072.1 ATP-dependent helicase [Francisella sp. 19S2-4]MED7829909.1 ATP-dependent helicase [Francisella sp. 19S2-10]